MTYLSDDSSIGSFKAVQFPVVASCLEFLLFLMSTLAYFGSSLFNVLLWLSPTSETTEICGDIVKLFLISGGVGGGGNGERKLDSWSTEITVVSPMSSSYLGSGDSLEIPP